MPTISRFFGIEIRIYCEGQGRFLDGVPAFRGARAMAEVLVGYLEGAG